VLTTLLQGFSGDKGTMQAIGTSGMHAFNGLPQDPSLEKLLEGGPAKLAENVQTHLIDKGAEMAQTVLDTERAQYLYDKMVADMIAKAPDQDNQPILERDAPLHRPTAGMTPAQLEAAFALGCDAYLVAESNDYDDSAEMLIKLRDSAKANAKGPVMQDLGGPEFVIADTNWGNSESHTFFVIAPDPTTGEPRMWEKAVPPGTLSAPGRDWVDAEWTRVK